MAQNKYSEFTKIVEAMEGDFEKFYDKEVKISKVTVTVAEATDEQFAKQFIESTTGIALA